MEILFNPMELLVLITTLLVSVIGSVKLVFTGLIKHSEHNLE